MKTRFAFIVILFSLLSCQRDIASCDCKQVDVYGMHLSILTMFMKEKDIRNLGRNEVVKDPDRIEKIKNFLLDLELSPNDYGEIDARVVLDLICRNGGKSTVILCYGIAQIGDKYYKVDNEQFYQLNLKEHRLFNPE